VARELPLSAAPPDAQLVRQAVRNRFNGVKRRVAIRASDVPDTLVDDFNAYCVKCLCCICR
jgi:hypothetical protein